MAKIQPHNTGGVSWTFRDIPPDVAYRMKLAAVVERKSVKQLLLDLSRAHLGEMEKKGLLPKK